VVFVAFCIKSPIFVFKLKIAKVTFTLYTVFNLKVIKIKGGFNLNPPPISLIFIQKTTNMIELKDIITFEGQPARRVWENEEWYFVIRDLVQILTDSKNPRQYIKNIKRRDAELSKAWPELETMLPIPTSGGIQKMGCTNTEGALRIVQSIPSRKAEPFKRWLAEVGYQRIQEIDNPALAMQRVRELYRENGYNDDWIDIRLQSIGIRNKLTNEWQLRGVKYGKQFAILTAEISQAIFEVSPSKHKEYKGLKRESLRDHMTEQELIFTMLGEVETRQEAQKEDAQGFIENKKAAKKGGKAARVALDAYEQETGKRVLSTKNFLHQIKSATQKKLQSKEQKGLFDTDN